MSSQTHDDATRLEDTEQLVEYMLARAKPSSEWVIGTEHEKIGWWPERGAYPTWEDPKGISALLEALEREAGWTGAREGKDIIALSRDGASITLEPGGQLELSGAPLRSLLETEAELDAHLAEIRRFSAPLGIEWSGLGLAPIGGPADMPRMPKGRYGIMRRYLPTRGSLALHMMHQTCTVQANFDYADEADAMEKLRASLLVQPIVTALFANSTVVEGQLVAERSFRARIWEDTDDDRYVFSPRLLEAGATLCDYIEWALDVPMFFTWEGDAYVDRSGLPFRKYMQRGEATVGDFALHLSTLFPDARLKQHLEVRGADMGDRAHVLALPALHTGLLYDASARGALLRLLGDLDAEGWWALRRAVPVQGLRAEALGASVQELGVEVARIAREGLSRWEPEALPLLDVLDVDLAEGQAPADRTRTWWSGAPTELLGATRIC